MLVYEVKFQKKSAYYTQRVNRFMCNILYMIHSSNLVLRSEDWVCTMYFFLENICDIVFGLFDTKIKQLI